MQRTEDREGVLDLRHGPFHRLLAGPDQLVRPVEFQQPDMADPGVDVDIRRFPGKPAAGDAVLDNVQRGNHDVEGAGFAMSEMPER